MAGAMAGPLGARTNFLKVTNLPVGLTDVTELLHHLGVAGTIQDMTMVEASTMVVSYQQRSAAEQAAFALQGLVVGGRQLGLALYHSSQDPEFLSNPAYKGLGQYIGRDGVRFHPSSFRPWAGPSPAQPPSAHQLPLLRPPQFQPPAPMSQPSPAHQPPQFQSSGVQPPPFQSFQPQPLLPPSMAWLWGGASPAPPIPSTSTTLSPTPTADPVAQHTVVVAPTGEPCAICLTDLDPGEEVRRLALCTHAFHAACLRQMAAAAPSPFLQCPTCKRVHGVRTGTRPVQGARMGHSLSPTSLPGHEGCGSLVVTFHFLPGVQGPEHPSPGRPYHPVGFPRQAFLPDTPEGLRALHGLYLAWAQRLLFTVGTSLTTGRPNCVTWNDIHLKTAVSGGEHSYPDPAFLPNLMAELAGFGITEGEVGAHVAAHPDLRTRGGL